MGKTPADEPSRSAPAEAEAIDACTEALPDPQVAQILANLAYWFGWFAFFPNTLVYLGTANHLPGTRRTEP